MKSLYTFEMAVLAMAAMAGCSIRETVESPTGPGPERETVLSEPGMAIVLTATQEGISPDTRTVLKDNGAAWWNPQEEISVFYGSGTDGGSKFTSTNTEPAATAEFEGSLATSGDHEYWAVYPYSAGNSCDGSSITTVIPSEQTAEAGNFSGNAFPAMGKSGSLAIPFYNICGGIKFSVTRSDIRSIQFRGNNGETLAGTIKAVFNSAGKPEVSSIISGDTEVTLLAPDGGTFEPGTYYYLTLLPGTLGSGFTMTFTTALKTGTLTSSKSQTIKRSIFGALTDIDAMVSDWVSTAPVPENVDLGLKVYWATFNVGASKPEEYGAYFAWGETDPKRDYSWETYRFWTSGSSSSDLKFSKYVTASSFGTVDDKTVLDPENDAACAILGGKWRMPTDADWTELRENCTWTHTKNYNGTGINGVVITSKISGYTEKSIFLPYAGCRKGTKTSSAGNTGYFWSSSLKTSGPNHAYFLNCYSGMVYSNDFDRYYGFPVRPVYDDAVHPVSVALEGDKSIYVDDSVTLTATITPSNATDKSVSWSSSVPAVATVDSDGKVTGLKEGRTEITVTTNDGGLTASCWISVIMPRPTAVDLGLTVKWASFNVGAKEPTGYGHYFGWGETEQKSDYSWANYKFRTTGDYYTTFKFSKYVTDSSYGTVDNKSVLDLDDDTASVLLGGNWRMPTNEEWAELRENCTWEWTDNYNGTGIAGRIITSNKTGYTNKSIFLPAAGRRADTHFYTVGSTGCYWSSSLNKDTPYYAWYAEIHSGGFGEYFTDRYYGYTIRPVTK